MPEPRNSRSYRSVSPASSRRYAARTDAASAVTSSRLSTSRKRDAPRKGTAELKCVPRAVIREFSTRRTRVVEELARTGNAGFYAAQLAAVETRERKQHVDLARLCEDWRARAAEHGLGTREDLLAV